MGEDQAKPTPQQIVSLMPTDVLLDDLVASIDDIGICKAVIACGAVPKDGVDVNNRIEVNEKIRDLIMAELVNRGVNIQIVGGSEKEKDDIKG